MSEILPKTPSSSLTDRPARDARPAPESLSEDLRARLSPDSRILVGPFERRLYSRDVAAVPEFFERLLHRTTPLLVVQPSCEADIVAVLRFAAERRLPIFPRGVSSAPLGGSVPTRSGITLDLSSMNRVLDVDEEALTVRVEPGTRWADLAERLRPLGLALLSSPSSRFSTAGGWAATGGLGTDAFAHGHFSDAVVSARVAVLRGDVLALKREGGGLDDFLGSEGQLGIFTELTLRVRRRPLVSLPRLVCFENENQATVFLEKLAGSIHSPSHVAFYDRARMAEENVLFRDTTGLDEPVVPEQDAVVLHFDDTEAERRFTGDSALLLGAQVLSDAAAHYVWEERFFPLKAQRIGPSLLGAEIVLPPQALPAFLRRARSLARRFGSEPAIEATICRGKERTQCVAIVSFPCDRNNRFDYLLRLLLTQLLVHAGVRLGGRPYGLGIWNAPFFRRRYDASRRRALLRRKAELDPAGLLNPDKFFSLRTRRGSIQSRLFAGPVFETGLHLARFFSPILGWMARRNRRRGEPARWVVPPSELDAGLPLLRETALRCTFCGACISVCPAYLLTRDERVTGRGKLQLAELLSRPEEVSGDEATAMFQCLRCRLCEEVCQTRLPLLDCYTALEKQVENRYGYPRQKIEEFVELLDAGRDRIAAVFGLDVEEWSPPGSPALPEEPEKAAAGVARSTRAGGAS